MSRNDNLDEVTALAQVADNYKFDPDKPAHRELFRVAAKIAEKKADREPLINDANNRHRRVLSVIGIVGVIVTLTFGIWLNHLNHESNIRLEVIKVQK